MKTASGLEFRELAAALKEPVTRADLRGLVDEVKSRRDARSASGVQVELNALDAAYLPAVEDLLSRTERQLALQRECTQANRNLVAILDDDLKAEQRYSAKLKGLVDLAQQMLHGRAGWEVLEECEQNGRH